jgi:hypothetical protein
MRPLGRRDLQRGTGAWAIVVAFLGFLRFLAWLGGQGWSAWLKITVFVVVIAVVVLCAAQTMPEILSLLR